MASRPKKNFVLIDNNNNDTNHVFSSRVDTVNAPANRPSWLPARVKKANVSKVGVEHL